MPKTSERQALETVVGVHGKIYPAHTVKTIDEQLVWLSQQIAVAGQKAPGSCAWMRADQNRLLERRSYLAVVDSATSITDRA